MKNEINEIPWQLTRGFKNIIELLEFCFFYIRPEKGEISISLNIPFQPLKSKYFYHGHPLDIEQAIEFLENAINNFDRELNILKDIKKNGKYKE